MQTFRALARALVCVGLGVGVASGCASSKSAQPTTALPGVSESARALAPVPRDPAELVVGAPESIVLARAAELRGSALFERLRPYVERATCASLSEWDDLVRATARAVLASRSGGGAEEWLLVLDGSYAETDVERVLRAASARTPRSGAAAPISVDRSGRFAITEDDVLAASLLERRLLVLGSKGWLRAALAAVDQPTAKLTQLPLWTGVAAEVRCTEEAVCVLAVANGSGARALQRGLASAGAKALGQQLVAADSALTLSLPAGAELRLRAQLPEPGAAEAAQRALKDWLWQVGLLTRLAGLPDVLSAAQVSANGAALSGALSVSEADLVRYEQRAGQLLTGAALSSCERGPVAASP